MAFLRLTILQGGQEYSELVNTDHIMRVRIDSEDNTILEMTTGSVHRVEAAFEDVVAALDQGKHLTTPNKRGMI